jgi:tetratricopeptide (TPR) repeat protein
MRDKAFQLIEEGNFAEALPLFRSVIEADPSDWNSVYLAGQCCRFMNDFDGAIEYLRRATELNSNEKSVWLALAIANQLNENWDNAIKAIKRAFKIDPDYVLAFNTLAMTQKRMGELEKADHNYNAGAEALARCILKEMSNTSDSPILTIRGSRNNLWIEYAMYAAFYIAANEDHLEAVATPNAEMAKEEERTQKHKGLFWIDQEGQDGKTFRLFLPNYFNTFHITLRRDRTYSELMGNRGLVLEMLGRQEDADKHFQEAEEFSPP